MSGLLLLGCEYFDSVIDGSELVSDLLEIMQGLVVLVAFGFGEEMSAFVGQLDHWLQFRQVLLHSYFIMLWWDR